MQATNAWTEANQLEPCECGLVDGTIVIIVYPVGFLISRSRKLDAALAPPNEVNTDEHAKTTKTLYFNSK